MSNQNNSDDRLTKKLVALSSAFRKNCTALWSTTSLLLGLAFSAFGDVCKPKAEYGPIIIAVACGIVAFLFLSRILSMPASEIDGDGSPKLVVRGFIFFALAGVLSGCTWFADHNDPNGWLSERIPKVAELQTKWGWFQEKIDNMDKNIEKGAKNSDELVKQGEKLVDNSEQMTVQLDKTVKLLEKSKATEAKRYLRDKRIDFTSENFARKVALGDGGILEIFYDGGMDPGILLPDGSNPIIEAVVRQTPNYAYILEQAINHGFKPNNKLPIDFNAQLGSDAEGLAMATFPDNRELLKGLDGKLARGGNGFSMGDFLLMTCSGPTDEIRAIIDKHGIDITGGIALRENFADMVEKQARENMNILNASGKYEKELNDRLNALSDCKEFEKADKEQFKTNPHGTGGLPQPEKIFAFLEKSCREMAEANEQDAKRLRNAINARLKHVNAQYGVFVDKFNRKAAEMNIKDFQQALERYRRGTEMFKEIASGSGSGK